MSARAATNSPNHPLQTLTRVILFYDSHEIGIFPSALRARLLIDSNENVSSLSLSFSPFFSFSSFFAHEKWKTSWSAPDFHRRRSNMCRSSDAQLFQKYVSLIRLPNGKLNKLNLRHVCILFALPRRECKFSSRERHVGEVNARSNNTTDGERPKRRKGRKSEEASNGAQRGRLIE